MQDSARTFKAAAVAFLAHAILFALAYSGPFMTAGEARLVRGGGLHETMEVVGSGGGERKSVPAQQPQLEVPQNSLGAGIQVSKPASHEAASKGSGPGVPGGGEAVLVGGDRPTYPKISRKLGEEGSVRLRLLIQPDGTVSDAQVTRSSGFDRLDQSALEFVRRARFQAPSETVAEIYTVNFVLKDGDR